MLVEMQRIVESNPQEDELNITHIMYVVILETVRQPLKENKECPDKGQEVS